jgi:MFS family permease
MLSFTYFGSSYIYDTPWAITKKLEDRLNITETQYNFLQSVYSIPNIILPIFGGMLILRFGFRIVLVFTTIIIAFSSLLAWMAMSQLNYWALVAARAIYGIGSET